MIYIASDHAGYKFKEELKKYLTDLGFEFEDLGNKELDPDDDYVDFAFKLAENVIQKKEKGVLLCGTGSGMALAANKVKGIRAVNCWNEEMAKQARDHLDSNILCLGEKILNLETAKNILKVWLNTDFSKKERHNRRIKKIDNF